MPTLVWRSLTAGRYERTSTRGVARAEALPTVSPDRLTRMLPADGIGHTRLERTLRTLFRWERGALTLADTVISTPCATAMAGVAWVLSSQERKSVYGRSLVRLVWTDGARRIPWGVRLGPQGGAAATHAGR
jgi:hypothetical protein